MPVTTPDIESLIDEVVHNSLTKPLEAASSFLNMGVKVVDTPVPISFPRLDSTFVPTWVGEGEQIPEATGISFGDVKLLPSTMDSLKAICKVSDEALRSSSLSLDTILSDAIVQGVRTKIDAHAFSALGDGIEQPRGIFHANNVAQMQKIDKASAAMELDDILDAVGVAMAEGIPLSGLRFVMSAPTLTAMRKIKDTSNRYIVANDAVNGVFNLMGVPVVVTKHIGDTTAALLTPSSWVVARDLSPSTKVLSELYADTGHVGLRVESRMDFGTLAGDQNIVFENIA